MAKPAADRAAPRNTGDGGRAAAARPDLLRLFGTLVLLKEQPCHGYELADRPSDLGVDARLGQSIYRVLRDVERRGLVTSEWDLSELGGPPRRVYTITDAGDSFLAEATSGLVHQRFALGQMLDRYRHLIRQEKRASRDPVNE